MIPGFHCSSIDHHDPATSMARLAEMGFAAIAMRPRRGLWDHETSWFESATAGLASAAKEHKVALVIDLDAPFYDDPDSAEPLSLASENRDTSAAAKQQIEGWIRRASILSPLAITFSTGRVDSSDRAESSVGDRPGQAVPGSPSVLAEAVLERLAAQIEPLAQLAIDSGVDLALRPRVDHAIATVAHFERFGQWLGGDIHLGLAADVGEMLLGGEFPIGQRLARHQHRLTVVYLCEPDLEHGCDQRFGRGDIDLARVWNVMTESGFAGPGIFRACGHSRHGFELAQEAIALTRE